MERKDGDDTTNAPRKLAVRMPTNRKRFLKTLAETCSVRLSTRAAGVAAATPYRWRAASPAFAEAWQAALATGYERLEQALFDYAISRIVQDADGAADHTILATDLQLASALVVRNRTAPGGKPVGKATIRTSSTDTDAALRKQLDSLARRLKPQ